MAGAEPSLSLTRRIVGSVVLSLGLILLLFGLVALWTIQESAEAAYRERVALAQVAARYGDNVLHYVQSLLEREAAGLALELDRPLTDDQRRQLARLRGPSSTFTSLVVADRGGTILWADPAERDVVVGSPSQHPCLQPVLQTGEPRVATVRPPSTPQTEAACLAAPLRDRAGRLAGALMADFEPAALVPSLLPPGDLGVAIHLEVVDARGRPLVSTGSPIPAGNDLAHEPLLAALIAGRTADYAIHTIPGGGEHSAHLVAYAPFVKHPSWGIVVEQPRDVALAVPRQLTGRLGLMGLAALCLAAGVAWLDVRRVVQPLKRLTAVAERFAAGELDQPIAIRRADELGILAGALETMRRRLRASLAEVAEWNRELERRVTARTAEVEARNRELAHLNAIAQTVTGSLDITPMLEQTLDRVLEITGADAGCVCLAAGDDAGLRLAAARGLPAPPGGQPGAAGWCRCDQVSLDGILRGTLDATAAPAVAACQAAGFQSCLTVPLPSGEGLQGILILGVRRAGHFDPAAHDTLLAIGRQVGLALAKARLYDSLRTREQERAELLQRVMAGQEEERRRLAQELHDDASQALASLRLGLERLAGGTVAPEETRRLAGQLQQVAAQTLAEVHRLAVELRPSVLDDLGLVAALDRYLHEAARRGRVAIDFAAVDAGDSRLIPAAETAIYRIVQAALTNVIQHAGARHVSVLLERREEKLVIVVEDDGRGFDLAAVRAGSLEARLGLAGMDERAALIGAALTIETAPGAGTTVFLEVPLGPNRRREAPHAEAAHSAG